MTDRAAIAVLVNIPARFDDFSDKPVMHELHVANQCRIGAILRAVLDDAFVLLRRSHELAAFINVVGKRLLDINILAGLASPDGSQRMPVVGGGNGDGVNVLVLERFADVLVGPGPFALGFLDGFCAFLEHVGIHVAQRDVFGFILHPEDVVDVGAALAVEPDGAHSDAVIGTEHFAVRHGAGDDDRRGGFSEELSPS